MKKSILLLLLSTLVLTTTACGQPGDVFASEACATSDVVFGDDCAMVINAVEKDTGTYSTEYLVFQDGNMSYYTKEADGTLMQHLCACPDVYQGCKGLYSVFSKACEKYGISPISEKKFRELNGDYTKEVFESVDNGTRYELHLTNDNKVTVFATNDQYQLSVSPTETFNVLGDGSITVLTSEENGGCNCGCSN